MGSGHFLVAAIDRIENRFTTWLQNNRATGILRELEYMREAAKKGQRITEKVRENLK